MQAGKQMKIVFDRILFDWQPNMVGMDIDALRLCYVIRVGGSIISVLSASGATGRLKGSEKTSQTGSAVV